MVQGFIKMKTIILAKQFEMAPSLDNIINQQETNLKTDRLQINYWIKSTNDPLLTVLTIMPRTNI